jgi:hypothetical protein
MDQKMKDYKTYQRFWTDQILNLNLKKFELLGTVLEKLIVT